jgi:hypothetical protein
MTASASTPETYCYRISPDGTVSGAKVTLTLDDRAVTFTGGNLTIPVKSANAAPIANAGTGATFLYTVQLTP